MSLSWISLLLLQSAPLAKCHDWMLDGARDDRENSRTANWLNYMPGNKPDGGLPHRASRISLWQLAGIPECSNNVRFLG
jgi:hypothetical protein